MSATEMLGHQIHLRTTPSRLSYSSASESYKVNLRSTAADSTAAGSHKVVEADAASDIFLIYCYVPEPKP